MEERAAETDLELTERLVVVARQLSSRPLRTARLSDTLRILELAVLLGRIGAGMPVARAEIKRCLRRGRAKSLEGHWFIFF